MRQGTSGRAAAAAVWRATVIGMLAAGALAFPITGAAAGSTAGCAMAPVVRDHTITQGVGSYAQLVPGKDTLVRLYLSLPSCAPADAEMQLTSASVTARSGLTAVQTTSTPALPTPPLTGTDTNTYPPIASFAAAPMKNATGDPLFVIDGDAFEGALPSTGGPLSVTASLGYRYRIAGGAWTHGSTAAPSTGTYDAVFGPATNALRVLVVPMGDRSAKTAQFPSGAVSTVQAGMLALSRLLPVPSGVGDLASTTGGVRYRVLPADTSMLDLGPAGLGVMTSSSFCGKGSNFDAIQAELAKYLTAWNSHPDHQQFPADRVVGAVWEGVSTGPESTSSCADGFGKVPGRAAWVRVRQDRSGAPSNTGALLAMELLHTWGAVSRLSSNDGTGFHSENVEADVSAPDRAYHVANRSWIAQDRAAMRYEPSQALWNQHNTLLEPPDWAHTQCALATTVIDPSTSPCAQPGAVGSAPAGIQEYFSLAGISDRTVAGTDVHSHLSEERVDTRPDGSSGFRLVQRRPDGGIVDDFGVPASSAHSVHTGEHDQAGEGAFEIAATVPRREEAVRFELWHGDPHLAGSVLLYAREDDVRPIAGAPATAPAAGDVVDVAASPDRNEVRPALTSDGAWVAWVEPDGIRVAPTDRSKTVSMALPGTDPSWADDGNALVFTRDGNVLRVTVDKSDAAATFSDEYVVYDRRLHLAVDPSASRPSVGPDGQRAAVAIGGDLFVLDTSFRPSAATPLLCPVGATVPAGPCRRVSGAPAAETAPSWSALGIFHERGAEIWVVGADGAGATKVGFGSMPAARGDQLVFVRNGQLWSRSSADGSEHALTVGSSDEWPAITDTLGVVAFDRSHSGQRDVVALDASQQKYVVTATDDQPGDLRLDVFLGAGDPALVGLRPTSVAGSTATFEFQLDNADGGGGTVSGRVTDGWNVAWIEWPEPLPAAPPQPALSIHTPVLGSRVLQFSPLSLSGDARVDATPLPESVLQWAFLTSGGQVIRQGTGRTVDLDPPTAGWTPGTYQVRLTATVGAQPVSEAIEITIVEDRDRDGFPATVDRRRCGAGADEDPTNFDDDSDQDGVPDVEDTAPCTSANNGTADFEPDVYYVPSQGLPFSVVVGSTAVDLTKVAAETVAIREVGRYPVHIPAVAWTVDKKGTHTAKFDRAELDAVLQAHPELVGGYVPIVITGGQDTSRFRVRDPSAPNVRPA